LLRGLSFLEQLMGRGARIKQGIKKVGHVAKDVLLLGAPTTLIPITIGMGLGHPGPLEALGGFVHTPTGTILLLGPVAIDLVRGGVGIAMIKDAIVGRLHAAREDKYEDS
jgi:hypothetical protein